jgi:AcrR family transcriptional regulator
MATRLSQGERREQTRRGLLAAARKVFGERGYGAATLDEIAAEAGLTRGALYYNFPAGKEDLFLALLDERVAERADSVRASFAAPAGPLETVDQARGAADDAFAAVRPNREWRLLTFELALHAARDGAFAQRYAEREDTIRQAIEEVVRARIEELGAEPPISPRDLATGLNALGNGLALDALVDDNAIPDGLFGRLVGFMVRGMFAAADDQQTNRRKP